MASNVRNPAIFADENATPSRQSVLRSILPSKAHRRNQSDGNHLANQYIKSQLTSSFLPPDHPHARQQRALAEMDVPNSARVHRTGENKNQKSNGAGLHKKTKSSVSLKSLLKDKDKDNNDIDNEKEKRQSKPRSPTEKNGDGGERRLKKTKSSTSLSAIFKRSQRDRKDGTNVSKRGKENLKENRGPPSPLENETLPIWEQFASRPQQDQTQTSYVPQNQRTLHEEMSLYTPKGYSPSKQRNFYDYSQPTLAKRSANKPRPKSDYLSSSSLTTKDITKDILGSVNRSISSRERRFSQAKPKERTGSASSRSSGEQKRQVSDGKKGSRVMAVINAFNAKEKASQNQTPSNTSNHKETGDIGKEFEELLVSCMYILFLWPLLTSSGNRIREISLIICAIRCVRWI